MFTHHHCSTCGVHVRTTVTQPTHEWYGRCSLNARTIKGVDVGNLKLKSLDGKKF